MMGLATLLTAVCPAVGADPPPRDKEAAEREAALRRDARELAGKIDKHIAAGWTAAKVEPAPLADDAEFLRRVYLDLAGRIPEVSEARKFLDDKSADKRQRLIEHLLQHQRYNTHFVNIWRALMLPEASASIQTRFAVPAFESWLRQQLTKNAGYDQMVRDILTAPVTAGNPRIAIGLGGEASPAGFYSAKEFKPENLAASTGRLFLGVRVECAQCHHHPFASWKREQFWSFAAFFAGIQTQVQGDFAFPTREVPDKREMTIPGTDKVVQATFLDGTEPKWKARVSARQTLAEWMTSADNPYFARATVNRLWFYFFGTGLIDPVDEMAGGDNTASHPELLDELAKSFAAHQFDLKFLIRAITNSKAYQLSSVTTNKDQDDPRLFARMALKGMTAEQLFDSVATATGYKESGPANDPRAFLVGNNSPRAEFLTKFASQSEKNTESQTSILQALALMNGTLITAATSLERSEMLAGLIDAPFMDTTQRVETLYLATLSRKPKAKELERMVKYVESGGAGEDKEKSPKHALADVFWVLLNSAEFILNH
jgi:hypothetical protein